jgi:hypothetical protein
MGCKRAAWAGAALAIMEMERRMALTAARFRGKRVPTGWRYETLTFTIRLFVGEWDKILTAIARVNCLHSQSKTGRGTTKGPSRS